MGPRYNIIAFTVYKKSWTGDFVYIFNVRKSKKILENFKYILKFVYLSFTNFSKNHPNFNLSKILFTANLIDLKADTRINDLG
jgi:hypothetical protein